MAKILNSNKILLFRHLVHNCLKSNQTLFINSFSTLNVNQNADQIKEVIQIPKRIERGPTDILRALAETTQRDPTAPDYQYVDDPFLTPHSNYQKRVFALSRESGRRSAKYVFEEFPELFFRDNSEPKIEAFTYRDIYDSTTEVDENDLKKCILRREVNHSIVCYQNLIRDSVEISPQTLQKLLELVCFYNCEEPPDMEFLIERTFMKPSETPRIVWKDNGFAEQLFEAIEDKTSEMYCSLIQGMAKHSQSQKAYQYYREMIEKGLKLNTETYNSLIKVTPMVRESSETRWMFVEDLFNCMKNNEIKPNLQTLNNTLEVINRFGTIRFAHNLAKKTLVEMTSKFPIQPSLATYYHLLNIFSKQRGPNIPILYDIMDRIEGQEFEIEDPKDVNFYVNAMNVCLEQMSDIQIAYKINESVKTGNNYKLLGNVLNVSNYYQKFFRLLFTAEDIKVFMDIYSQYVPHIYIPEPIVFEDLFKAIDLYEAFDYLPQIWEDLNRFEYLTNVRIIESFYILLSKAKVDDNLQKQLSRIVTDGIKTFNNKIENQLKDGHIVVHQFTGLLLGSAIDVYLNDNDIESAVKIIQILKNEKHKVIGNPSPKTFSRLAITAIDQKIYSLAKNCVEFCIELGMFEVSDQVIKHIRQLDIDSDIKQQFEDICDVSQLFDNQSIDGEDIRPTDQIDSNQNI